MKALAEISILKVFSVTSVFKQKGRLHEVYNTKPKFDFICSKVGAGSRSRGARACQHQGSEAWLHRARFARARARDMGWRIEFVLRVIRMIPLSKLPFKQGQKQSKIRACEL